jgi:hypothetical protein
MIFSSLGTLVKEGVMVRRVFDKLNLRWLGARGLVDLLKPSTWKFGLVSLSVFGLALYSQPSSAMLYTEPYFSYEQSDYNNGDKVKGTQLGARLGVAAQSFIFGVDYLRGIMTRETSAGARSDYDPEDLGVFLGYKYSESFRFGFTYFVSHKVDGSSTAGDGGMKFGVGYTFWAPATLYFELIKREYDDNSSTDGYLVSIGFPSF